MMNPQANDSPAGRVLAHSPWWQGPGLTGLVGLLPLLAVSRTFTTGLALGIASLAVLCATNVLVTALAGSIPGRLRVTAFLALIAALVTGVDLLFQAHWFGLYGQVGLFVPLIVANGFILARAESFATRRSVWQALLDGLAWGTAWTLLLSGVGALRELLAPGLLIAALPTGALFLLAALVTLRQAWLRRGGKP